MDMVIGVIAVVIWIATQIAGRKKPGDQTPEQMPGPVAEPQDELRKFFEEIEKNIKGPVETAPAQPPPKPVMVPVRPPPSIPAQAPVRATSWTSHAETTPLRTFATAPARAADDSAPVVPGKIKPARPAISPPLSITSPLMPELRDPIALRKAIVALEILGKPVALRTS